MYEILEKSSGNLLRIIEKIVEFKECSILPNDIDTIIRANSNATNKSKPVIIKLITQINKQISCSSTNF